MSNQTLASDGQSVPAHVAIIMDGNNRWAKKKHLPSIAGHRAGAAAVRKTVETAARSGVKVLTLFAFSSENWKRPQAEVDGLMGLFMRSLKKEAKRLNQHSIKLVVVGDKSGFSKSLQDQIHIAEQATAENNGMVLAIAANYGGRWDIAQAAKELARKVSAGEMEIDDISEESLGQFTCLAGLPELDLIIRTSGEERVSNFLLWQLAYAEFIFMPVLWPDFSGDHFEEALATYQQRQRRYGGR
ncbi:polyprenyl diphosphate synthase [Marinomonas ostreistagni]|uniref:Ditrans,polycis-undecaprenyl-diphosphate synthase ((2E,6E)-farnesyl-diphosphate specific) n=1 Tax=Marinomonas ostreistagni TaxID=359209 RepID=A0ABS0ZAJ4_9GAMM|nr:polyprenyl diphosphate synthase [Marinomonas ostreistagni]MBJ7550689.1 di-trans,poly-cis-decaprenylcistransferase [Marinomonas ostreistagni]